MTTPAENPSRFTSQATPGVVSTPAETGSEPAADKPARNAFRDVRTGFARVPADQNARLRLACPAQMRPQREAHAFECRVIQRIFPRNPADAVRAE